MYKTKQGTGLKILTTNQMIQILPIALAQVKAGNNSKNVLNEINCFFVWIKKLLKKYTIT